MAIVTFILGQCFSPMLWMLYCSDFNTIWRISFKMNVLSHSIKEIVLQKPIFDMCRIVYVIGKNIRLAYIACAMYSGNGSVADYSPYQNKKTFVYSILNVNLFLGGKQLACGIIVWFLINLPYTNLGPKTILYLFLTEA